MASLPGNSNRERIDPDCRGIDRMAFQVSDLDHWEIL